MDEACLWAQGIYHLLQHSTHRIGCRLHAVRSVQRTDTLADEREVERAQLDETSPAHVHSHADIAAHVGEPASKARRRAPPKRGAPTSRLPRPRRERRDATASAPAGAPRTPQGAMTRPLVMQLIVDRDLINSGWTIGPMMAQAAHAAMAILVQSRERPDTQTYVSPEHLPHMHKIVLQTPKNMSLRDLAGKLAAETHEAMPPHYLWVEQPENVPTALRPF
ncbi:hypothetical protein MNAN1_000788 [Malassezia nana]|uniref:peptidyl-tRNA hydrolase n=1 Tax=Malassezia nana TaxID=180528 RepID=A0AAF0J1E2_9BASI|nr:hypothetical protein MNAN1_000788 [Malassezia nana]